MRKTRSRLVNFRVTDEELEQLRIAADRQGARCLSDFARSSVLNRSYNRSAPEPVDERLSAFERRLAIMEHSMSRLVEALTSSRAYALGSEK